jgi:hypothetical protein
MLLESRSLQGLLVLAFLALHAAGGPNPPRPAPQVRTPPPSTQRVNSGAAAKQRTPPANSAGKRSGGAAPKTPASSTASKKAASSSEARSYAPPSRGGATTPPASSGGKNGVTTYTPGSSASAAAHAPGHSINTASGNGTGKSFSNASQNVDFRSNGSVAAIHSPGLDVRRSAAGTRTVTSAAAGGKLVSTGPGSGYLQKNTVSGGRSVVQRTYVAGGRTFTRTYLGYNYAGLELPYYVSGFYYPPDFYGWAYYGWPVPAVYAWDWNGDAWVGVNAGYFTPDPSYRSGAAWLTDYALAQTLSAGYASQQQDSAGKAGDDQVAAEKDTPVTPELKSEITAEVQHQIAYANGIATGQAPATVGEFPASLKPGRVFVVADALDVSTSDDRVCSLVAGDVLRLESAPEGSATATLRVASSHRQDCPAGIAVTVSLTDLEETVNSLRGQVDAGLAELHGQQGQRGLPAAPASSMGATKPSEIAPAHADANVAALIDQQRQQALAAETAAKQ